MPHYDSPDAPGQPRSYLRIAEGHGRAHPTDKPDRLSARENLVPMQVTDPRRHSPAAERNSPSILAQLQRLLPAHGLMLEIASGSGQHAACFSQGLPGWRWQPTEFDASALASISAWCEGLDRVLPPLSLDVQAPPWPAADSPRFDGMFCANLMHIAPWPCTGAIMQLAASHLTSDGVLITYGPYIENGVVTAPGNLAFDADLRARNPAWGLRHLEAVEDQARQAGLHLRERVEMPANNLLLVWSRSTVAHSRPAHRRDVAEHRLRGAWK